jgi:hypothetical protein
MATMKADHSFQLSVDEFRYLEQLLSDHALANQLRVEESPPSRRVNIRLNGAEAEQLRDYLTHQLAVVGFDRNYSPNEEGRRLEELIDRFYI